MILEKVLGCLMKKVTLYGYPTSPYVIKVGCFLKYKKIPFEYVPVNPVSPIEIKFTGQRQVPVLKIDQEWRKDSTHLGIWLDEIFPEKPLLGINQSDTNTILLIDKWVSDNLILGKFRAAVEWENTWDALRNGWLLSRAVNHGTKIPFFVKRAKFIGDMILHLNTKESISAMRLRLCDEFIQHLRSGPFLGGRQQISLADLSAYMTIISSHLMGMHGESPFLKDPQIVDWCRRVQAELPNNPLLIADILIEREHVYNSSEVTSIS